MSWKWFESILAEEQLSELHLSKTKKTFFPSHGRTIGIFHILFYPSHIYFIYIHMNFLLFPPCVSFFGHWRAQYFALTMDAIPLSIMHRQAPGDILPFHWWFPKRKFEQLKFCVDLYFLHCFLLPAFRMTFMSEVWRSGFPTLVQPACAGQGRLVKIPWAGFMNSAI